MMKPVWNSQRVAPWIFLAPFLVIFGMFTVVPLARAFVLAMQQTYGPETTNFVGWNNFVWLAQDPLFWKALTNTSLFAAASVFLQLPLSLGLALWLNQPKLRGRAIFRLIFFSPALFGVVFVAILFGLVFEKYTGLLNLLLNRLTGFPLDFPWLEEYSMAALVIASIWMYTGFNMVYFLAALQGTDPTLIEAAKIDGAGAWRRFLHVTLPQIRPVAAFVVLLSLLGSFQIFELPYILYGGGGPGDRVLTVVMYLFQNGFEVGDLGYASAIGWVLALILITFAVLQAWLNRRNET